MHLHAGLQAQLQRLLDAVDLLLPAGRALAQAGFAPVRRVEAAARGQRLAQGFQLAEIAPDARLVVKAADMPAAPASSASARYARIRSISSSVAGRRKSCPSPARGWRHGPPAAHNWRRGPCAATAERNSPKVRQSIARPKSRRIKGLSASGRASTGRAERVAAQLGQLRPVEILADPPRVARRSRQPALAAHDGGDALAHNALHLGIERKRQIAVRVHVDEAGRHGLAARVHHALCLRARPARPRPRSSRPARPRRPERPARPCRRTRRRRGSTHPTYPFPAFRLDFALQICYTGQGRPARRPFPYCSAFAGAAQARQPVLPQFLKRGAAQ